MDIDLVHLDGLPLARERISEETAANQIGDAMLEAAVETYSTKHRIEFADHEVKRKRMIERVLELKTRHYEKYRQGELMDVDGYVLPRENHVWDLYLPNSCGGNGPEEWEIDSEEERSVQRARRKWYRNPDNYDMERDKWRTRSEVAALIQERIDKQDQQQRGSMLSFLFTGKCLSQAEKDQPQPEKPKNKYYLPRNADEEYTIADDTISYHQSWVDPDDNDPFFAGDVHLRFLMQRWLKTGKCSSPAGQQPPEEIYIKVIHWGGDRRYYIDGNP